MKNRSEEIKPKFYFIRKAVKQLQKSTKCEEINDVLKCVNNVVKIHKEVLDLINNLESLKEWELLQDTPGYYQLKNTIEDIYFKTKDKYHELHFNKYQYNAY